MTFLLLPILPDRPVDPWGAVNPRKIWLLAILMATISFGGYVAVRLLGDGSASSPRRSPAGWPRRPPPRHPRPDRSGGGADGASVLRPASSRPSTVMVIRVGVVAGLINHRLVQEMLIPIAAVAAGDGRGRVESAERWARQGPCAASDHQTRSTSEPPSSFRPSLPRFCSRQRSCAVCRRRRGSRGRGLVRHRRRRRGDDLDGGVRPLGRRSGLAGAGDRSGGRGQHCRQVGDGWSIGGTRIGLPLAAVGVLAMAAGARRTLFDLPGAGCTGWMNDGGLSPNTGEPSWTIAPSFASTVQRDRHRLLPHDRARRPSLLVDCGMFQGIEDGKGAQLQGFPLRSGSAGRGDPDACPHRPLGLLPKLVKAGYTGPIFATPPTTDLCAVMLPDSGHIQEYEVEQLNRRNRSRGRNAVTPIYTADDATVAMTQFRSATSAPAAGGSRHPVPLLERGPPPRVGLDRAGTRQRGRGQPGS